MSEAGKLSLEQVQAFLEGSGPVQFEARSQVERYEWVTRTLGEQGYEGLGKVGKGVVRRYMAKMRGLSRAQVTRLIGQYTEQGEVTVRRARRHRFRARYSKADIELLALVDEAHDTLSGPATQKILYREFHEFAEAKFESLAAISVAHIYNLRKGRQYRERRMNFEKTRPTKISIGERRRPEPEGRADICGSTRCTKGTWME
jgi:transposase